MEPNIQQPIQPDVPIFQPISEVPQKSSKTRIILIILAALIVLVVIGTSGYYLGTRNQEEKTVLTPSPTPKLIGGDKDEHGCLIGAGYSWCKEKNKCLRIWEEPCPATTSASPSTDETANWKTYISNEYGYTLKYPYDWTAERPDLDAGETSKDRYYLVLDKGLRGKEGDYYVTVKHNENFTSPNNYSATRTTKINIAGIEVTKLEFNPDPGADRIMYFFTKNETSFLVSVLYFSKSDNIGEKIISTIKFTN